MSVLQIITLIAVGYVFNCIYKLDIWFRHERDLPLKQQRHREWWKL